MRRFVFEFTFGNADIPRPQSVERDMGGNWWNWIWSSEGKTGKGFTSDKERINTVLNNPAALKVWKINADLGSLGKINKFVDNKEIEKDVLFTKKAKPNFYQGWTQFFWDYYFWIQFGTAYMYRTNNVFGESTQLYWLNPANIEWDDSWKRKLTKFTFSMVGFNEQLKETVRYKWPDGTETNIKLKDITPFYDLSNGIEGNWFKGTSDLDSLYKVIRNSEYALDAKAINLEFSQKFMVSGKNSIDEITNTPMAQEEKDAVEQSIRNGKKVHAVKSEIDIKRFVDNINNLKLDEQFFNDYFTIGAMKGIPRDILELGLKGATYENQEKSIGRHVEYALKPKGQLITDAFEELFGWEDLRFSWAHLSFNQVFEKDRAERVEIQLRNLAAAKELGGMSDTEVKDAVKLIMAM